MPTLGNAIFQAAGFRPGANGIMFQSDNAADIGAAAANRPRDLHLGRNLAVGGTIVALGNITGVSHVAGATDTFLWTGRARIKSSADGIVELFNAAETGFTRLNFGGTSSAFPSLKRSGAALLARVADDTGYCLMAMDSIALVGPAGNNGVGTITYGASTQTTVGAAGGASALPATPRGYAIINVSGTDRVIPYYDKT